jgi:hypothetical protein
MTINDRASVDLLVARLQTERDWLDHAIAECDWRFSQRSALEARRAAIAWVLDLVAEAAA